MGFPTNLVNNATRKKSRKCKDVVKGFKSKYKKVNLVNFVMSTFGVLDNSSVEFLEML